uniref:WAT1-related protein n=1 Tax=Kalanchoe fedtschenkoi TaxID=63787 RepID=A0A7N0VLW3_KALFE
MATSNQEAGGVLLRGASPALVLVLVQAVYAGVSVLYQVAMNDGMSVWTLVAYRTLFAAASTLLLALSTESRKSVPKITWRVLLQASFSCFLMVVYQYAYVESLRKTSPTIVSAITNLTPAATLALALIFRAEKLHLARVGGVARVAGMLVGICGAMVITFYKGAEIPMWRTNINLVHHHGSRHGMSVSGIAWALGCCFASAVSLTSQANLGRRYPYPYTITALTNFTASVVSVAMALCVEKDSSQWRLRPDVKLLAVLYSGIFASGVAPTLITWCVKLKGEMFAAAFSPLVSIFAGIAGALLLEERLHLGSILGAVLIWCGLFMVIWAKGRETTEEVVVELPVVQDSTATSPPNPIDPLELSDMNTIDAVVIYDSAISWPPDRTSTNFERSVYP